MPTYTNPTAAVITIGQLRVEPGETKNTKIFEPQAAAAGLTVNSSVPYFDNVISSTKATGATTVTVPQSVTGNYRVHMFVPAVSGNEATVKLNGGAAVARYIGAGESVDYTCLARTIDNVIVTAVTGALYITIEAI